jgi:hypothetical protein
LWLDAGLGLASKNEAAASLARPIPKCYAELRSAYYGQSFRMMAETLPTMSTVSV